MARASVESRRLRKEVLELSARHPRYGYRRITALLAGPLLGRFENKVKERYYRRGVRPHARYGARPPRPNKAPEKKLMGLLINLFIRTLLKCGAGCRPAPQIRKQATGLFGRLRVFFPLGCPLFQTEGTVLVGIDLCELFLGRVRSLGLGFKFLQADLPVLVGIDPFKLLLLRGSALRMAEGGVEEGETDDEGCCDDQMVFHF